MAPLRFEGRVIGAVNMLNKPGGFTESDRDTIEEFVFFAGNALGKSKKISDGLRAGWFLVRKFEATAGHLIVHRR